MSVNIKLPGGSADTATLQAEIDATQAGAGLGSSGAYTPPAGSNYLASASSLNNADSLLDAQIKVVSDEVDELSGLTSNVVYVNDGVDDVQVGIDAATNTNTLVWCSPGSYGGSTVTLTNKNLLKLRAEGTGTGGFGVAELVSRGLTISGASSTRNLVQGFQVEGLTTINGTQGRHALIDCQLLGGLTITNGTSNFVTVRDCDIAGTVTIAAGVSAVVYFINCNFAAGASIANSALAAQVIIANCGGVPAAALASVTMAGQSGLSDGSFRGFFSALTLPSALAFTGNTNQLTNGAGFITAATAPVTEVNTLTGAVTISGQNTNTNHSASNYTAAGSTLTQHIAGVDTALGARALSSSLATVATSGAYSDLSGKPTLGTAAALNVGTSALNVVQLDASAKLPAVDGSALTNLPSGATSLDALTDVTISSATNGQALIYSSSTSQWVNEQVAYANVSGTPYLATVATSGAYSDLSGTPSLATVATSGAYSDLSGTPTLATVATSGAYSDLTGKPSLGTAAAEDVGTAVNDVVQLVDIGGGVAGLPAVDGSQLSGIVASASKPTVTSATPSGTYAITTYTGLEEVYVLTPTANTTVSLPAAASAGAGYRYRIKNLSTFTLTIDPNSSETIDGAATFSTAVQYASISLLSTGSAWIIV